MKSPEQVANELWHAIDRFLKTAGDGSVPPQAIASLKRVLYDNSQFVPRDQNLTAACTGETNSLSRGRS